MICSDQKRQNPPSYYKCVLDQVNKVSIPFENSVDHLKEHIRSSNVVLISNPHFTNYKSTISPRNVLPGYLKIQAVQVLGQINK